MSSLIVDFLADAAGQIPPVNKLKRKDYLYSRKHFVPGEQLH